MRDKESPFTNRQYISLPIDFTGWEQKSDGAYARPSITFANVLTTFSDLLGSFENDDLIGLKIVRRKTLATHLDNIAGDAHGSPAAPSEYPTQSYVIDRIASFGTTTVTFELASPFDLAGVMIPARAIMPHTCCWAYQGLAVDTPYNTPVGACTWKLTANNNGVAAFFDARNNLFATGHNITAATAASANDFFRTVKGLNRTNVNGSNTSISSFDYWQAAAPGTTPYRRVRLYTTYNGATTYYTYAEGDLYNDVVLYGGTLWVCIRSHDGSLTPQTPALGSKYWKRADICGKKLSSCAVRFKSQSVSNLTGTTVSVTEDATKVLPYGGFPASRRYNSTS